MPQNTCLHCSLPGQGLLDSSDWQSLPPHFGTQAAVQALQQVLRAADVQLQKLTGSQAIILPDLTPAKQTGMSCFSSAHDAVCSQNPILYKSCHPYRISLHVVC